MPPQYIVLPSRGSPYLQPLGVSEHDTVRCVVGPYTQLTPKLVLIPQNPNPRWRLVADMLNEGQLFVATELNQPRHKSIVWNLEFSSTTSLHGNCVLKISRDVNLACFVLLETIYPGDPFDPAHDPVECNGLLDIYQESVQQFDYRRSSIW